MNFVRMIIGGIVLLILSWILTVTMNDARMKNFQKGSSDSKQEKYLKQEGVGKKI